MQVNTKVNSQWLIIRLIINLNSVTWSGLEIPGYSTKKKKKRFKLNYMSKTTKTKTIILSPEWPSGPKELAWAGFWKKTVKDNLM